MTTRRGEGLPVTMQKPGPSSYPSRGMQRMVAFVSALMRSSVSGVPSQWQRKKPPFSIFSLNSSYESQ